MDIYKYINSRDIREHLKRTGYEFTSLEAAWLVWQCNSITLAERHAAWKEIIDTMPDCEVPERMNCIPFDSLRYMLRRYMAVENKYIAQFYADEPNTVYRYEDCWLEEPLIFCFGNEPLPSFDRAYADFRSHMSQETEAVIFRKEWVGSKKCIDIKMTPDEEIISVEVRYCDTCENAGILACTFEGMFLRFPLPFKKGDILCRYIENTVLAYEDRCPFVFIECITDVTAEKQDYCKDYTDMCAYGYFASDRGALVADHTVFRSTYMDLEYYRGRLDGANRSLLLLSRFLKGEGDAVKFANAYHIVRCEEEARRT